jgi:hypothetical protein
MRQRTYTVRVVYKGGATVDIDCKNFKIERNGLGNITQVTWEDAHPHPIVIGVDEIAAVFQTRPERKL